MNAGLASYQQRCDSKSVYSSPRVWSMNKPTKGHETVNAGGHILPPRHRHSEVR
jgi:hypothetical protein